jgi:integrase
MAARRSYGTGSLVERTDTAGRVIWHAQWRVNGRQVMRRVGPKRAPGEADGLTKPQAEARLRELIAATVTTTGGRVSITIDTLHARYVADRGRRLKSTTLTDYEAIVRNHLGPYFRGRTITSLTRIDLEGLVAHLVGLQLAPKSIDNYVTYLAALLNYAVDREWLVRSPACGVTLPEDPDDVDELRFLEVIEVHDLIERAAEGPYRQLDRALYALAAMAGLRQGECLGLLWRAVDVAASRLRVEENVVRTRRTTPKSRQRRSLPLSAQVATEILELRDASRWTKSTDPVFADPLTGQPLARTPLMRRYRVALAAAKLDLTFRFHDLRHTFGTTMARSGAPVTTIQAWMGHSDLRTTQRYMHYAPAHDEAEVIAAAFALADPRHQHATNSSESGKSQMTSAA